MKRLLVMAALIALAVPVYADLAESARYAGSIDVSMAAGPRATPVIVYDDTTAPSAAVAAVSSYDKLATWGDETVMTGTGTLRQFAFSLYNSGTSPAALVNPAVQIGFYDAATGTPLGGFTGNITTSLNPGYYTIVTFSDLDQSFTLNLTSADIIVTQKITSYTGNVLRAGIAMMNPVGVGSSPGNDWYWSGTDATLFPSGAGWYALSTATANNVAYQIGLTPEPASFLLVGVGLLLMRRR